MIFIVFKIASTTKRSAAELMLLLVGRFKSTESEAHVDR